MKNEINYSLYIVICPVLTKAAYSSVRFGYFHDNYHWFPLTNDLKVILFQYFKKRNLKKIRLNVTMSNRSICKSYKHLKGLFKKFNMFVCCFPMFTQLESIYEMNNHRYIELTDHVLDIFSQDTSIFPHCFIAVIIVKKKCIMIVGDACTVYIELVF